MGLNIKHFPPRIKFQLGLLDLDRSRLLICFRKEKTLGDVQKLLLGTGLELEDEPHGKSNKPPSPESEKDNSQKYVPRINHTKYRYWIREQCRRDLSAQSVQILNSNRWQSEISWYGPVYLLRGTQGLKGIACPLPHILAVRERCDIPLRSKLAKLGLTPIPRQPKRKGKRACYCIYRIRSPKKQTVYELPKRIRSLFKQGKPKIEFSYMPLLSPLAQAPTYTNQPNLDQIKAEAGWQRIHPDDDTPVHPLPSKPVIVAVIDQGCDLNHPELQPAYIDGAAFLLGSQIPGDIGDADPGSGHGTACAGIIAARRNDVRGITGIAYECQILPIKLVNMSSTGLAKAIDYARLHQPPANVISISLADYWYVSDEVETAIRNAYDDNIVICAASGDTGSPELDYPAAFSDYVIACGASDMKKNRADQPESNPSWASNYGPGLSVVAPGERIHTTTNVFLGSYTFDFDGTSAATPHVAALAALILSVQPGLSPDKVRECIEATAQPVRPTKYTYNQDSSKYPDVGWNEEMGYGLIDIDAAIDYAMNNST